MTSYTQLNIISSILIKLHLYLGQFAAQTIKTCYANSSTENTPIASYLFCSHSNSLISSPHPIDFTMLAILSSNVNKATNVS